MTCTSQLYESGSQEKGVEVPFNTHIKRMRRPCLDSAKRQSCLYNLQHGDTFETESVSA